MKKYRRPEWKMQLISLIRSDNRMELNGKALKILLKYNPLNPSELSEEDFQYAKDAGYMFEPVMQTHDEAMELAFLELSRCNKKHTADLFLSSFSQYRLDWRIGLSAYAIMKVFPKHSPKSNGYNCVICSSTLKEKVDFSFVNKVRFNLGGIITGEIYDLNFILQQHNNLPHIEPTTTDFEIFKTIIEVIVNAENNDGPSKIQKKIGKIEGFKSKEEQRKALLETLGYCSILETEKHKGFLHQYTNLGLAPRFKHKSDWRYPVDWWKGIDGINKEALEYWFGEYDELKSLFV